ncbi:hypothetical protein [Candidatus Tisiphia endosymbiont of Sialis lutaria]|uniref:hypothetical protein n=1 Tax=Candidatus Tisiphia endosymbiont of Sialis lutaria TaxID=2029164 RepID=UPI00312C7908
MSYFLQPKRVKYRITLVIVGSLLEVTTSPTSPELTILTIYLLSSYSNCLLIFLSSKTNWKFARFRVENILLSVTLHNSLRFFQNRLPHYLSVFFVVDLPISW